MGCHTTWRSLQLLPAAPKLCHTDTVLNLKGSYPWRFLRERSNWLFSRHLGSEDKFRMLLLPACPSYHHKYKPLCPSPGFFSLHSPHLTPSCTKALPAMSCSGQQILSSLMLLQHVLLTSWPKPKPSCHQRAPFSCGLLHRHFSSTSHVSGLEPTQFPHPPSFSLSRLLT